MEKNQIIEEIRKYLVESLYKVKDYNKRIDILEHRLTRIEMMIENDINKQSSYKIQRFNERLDVLEQKGIK